jgi:hypothetical protein
MKSILKLGLAAIIGLVAVSLIASSGSTRKADAEPSAVVALNEGNCIALGTAFAGLNAITALGACQTMQKQESFQTYIHCLRGFDLGNDGLHDCLNEADPTSPLYAPAILQGDPADFTSLDIDANQIHRGEAYEIIAFVRDDFPVLFKTNRGHWTNNNLQEWNCSTALDDPDCDQDIATLGDGVVVQHLALGPDDGDSGTVEIDIVQENISFPVILNVVGPAETITLTPLFGKDTIQTGATQPTQSDCAGGPCQAPDPTDCNFEASVNGVLGANNQAEKAVVVAKALDNDGNEVAGALINWDHSFTKIGPSHSVTAPDLGPLPQGGVALPQTPTIDTGALGIGFPQFVCGGDTPGDLKLTATFAGVYDSPSPAGINEKTSITLHVIGPATDVALTADPPELDCNGTNTTTITATFVNAEGDPVADGLDANFNVQALGVVNPITTNTAKGVASTVLTPLSGANNLTADGGPAGVIVNVTANGQIHELFGQGRLGPHQEWDQVTKSILVRCTGGPPAPGTGTLPPEGGAAPEGAGAGAGAGPTGRIAGPDTGSAGTPDAAGLTWWPLLGLIAAAMTLGGATVALRRTR